SAPGARATPPVQAPPASPWLVLKKPWVIALAAIVVLALLWLVI
ncbi:flagella biosynthesis regulator Flk, partial [Klebsiella michiganensis]|nr:flagella biosynthesis regulator Flk [Klebsiella michiganensis]